MSKLVPISLPECITVVEADQTRYTRCTAPIHDLSAISTYRCSVIPNTDSFRNSYLYRTMHHWNVYQWVSDNLILSRLSSQIWLNIYGRLTLIGLTNILSYICMIHHKNVFVYVIIILLFFFFFF